MAPLARWGLFMVGASVFLDQVRPMISDAQFTWGERRVMGIVALSTLGGFGLAGWAAGRLLHTASELIEVFVESAEAQIRASQALETHLIPIMNRLATSMDRLAGSGALAPNGPADALARAVAVVRQALRAERWGQAESLLHALERDHPGAPEIATLQGEYDRARAKEFVRLRAELDDALSKDDPNRAIEVRDALTLHLRGPELHDLDRRVVRWLTDRIQTHIRDRTITPELVALAERTADSFGDAPEAAALLAALPRLRRRAGLCIRCGAPRRGSGDLCSDCLHASAKEHP